MPPKIDINNLITLNPATGKFQLGPAYNWSPAYSGQSRYDRVRRQREMYDVVQAYRRTNALEKMLSTGYDPEGEGNKYVMPDSGDPDWDMSRVQADYLNWQLQGQAARAGEQEPGGIRGVLYDALNNPAGSLVLRGLDIIGRPGYAVQAGLKGELRAVRGESPDHPGWVPLDSGYIESQFDMDTGRSRVLDTPSNRRARSGGQFWKNVETGEIERHDDWDKPYEGGRTQRALRGFAGGTREGITGRDKASFGQVLREADWLKGKPSAVAGFAGDVALDPTSYVSFGTSTVARKGGLAALEVGEREAIEAAARSTAADAVRTGAVKGPMAERRAYRTALDEALKDAGVSRRPVKQVIDDINSSYGEHSVERAMRDRVTEALKDPFWQKGTQRKIASDARKLYDAERAAAGLPVEAVARRKVGLDAVQSARDEFTRKVGADVMDEIATRKALRESLSLDIKVAGRTVASSRTAGRAISGVSKAMRGSRFGNTIAKTFRTDAEIGEALHRLQRQYYNTSAAQFESEAKEVKRVFQGLKLSKDQRIRVARAVESGDTKGFTEQMVEGYDRAKEFLQRAFDREVEAGALKPEDFKDNYLYHVYRNPEFSRGLGSWVKPVSGKGAQKFPTLELAEAGGARPLTDVADILVYRLAKSHRVASSHLMMQEIAGRFGINLSGKKLPPRALRGMVGEGVLVEGRKISGVGRYFEKGTYFDQDVAASLSKMNEVFSNDAIISKFGRLFDQVQARMKFLQTAPNPGFHIRNTMSDMFVNFLDGVTSPAPYRKALRLVRGENLEKVSVRLADGTVLKGPRLIELYDGMGLRAGFFHAEAGIVPGMGNRLLTGSSNVIRRGSEIREDVMRMAHFIDALGKTPKVGRVEEAAEMAAKRVRKYNFDYQDLTPIEKRLFRRAVPFYTFMRKNVPLMLESYFTRPGRMIVPDKANRALAAFMGQDNRDEPLPGMVNATPEWIRNTPGAELVPIGPNTDPVSMQVDMPYNQLEQLFGGFAQGSGVGGRLEGGTRQLLRELLLEQSTPLVRGVAEYATQTDLATGADVPQTPLDAVINQFPVGRLVQRPLSKQFPGLFFESDRPGSPTYTVRVGGKKIEIGENVANYITGLGFRKVTPERMQSELRRRQDVIEGILRRQRTEYEEEYMKEWEERFGDLNTAGG